jgi:hypothetical protein
MKRLTLAGIANLTLALGALAQGTIDLDDSKLANGVATQTAGDYYTGTYGMEVWELSGATVIPAGINGSLPYLAYDMMVADGFTKEATFAHETMTVPGTFVLGEITLPNVTPAGSAVVLGLAVWDTSDLSWNAMLIGRGHAIAGVIAFVNPTANPAGSGPPPVPANLTGWTPGVGDLVMVTPLPEPSALALAGVGVAALFVLRRRK